MATKPKEPVFDEVHHHWICEGCDAANLGVNPPDQCRVCGHAYFENLADQLEDDKTRH